MNYPVRLGASDANLEVNRPPEWTSAIPTMNFKTRQAINVKFRDVVDPENDTLAVKVGARHVQTLLSYIHSRCLPTDYAISRWC